MTPLTAVDLFCGAGGTSTGILSAASDLGRPVNLLAINHWITAIKTHTLNHPRVRHLCESLENITPRQQVPGGRLHLLAASPECTHHSVAAGGRPRNDQSRATAWHVCRWVSELRVDNLLIENVREFVDWGPLDARGKPLKSRKGETFKAFLQALQSLGLNVEYRIVNAADFGDPTSRKRLFILGRRGKPVQWPAATHGPDAAQPHRGAREIIDWSLPGASIFNRRRPLAPNTLRRIAAGLRKFGGASAQPFLIAMEHGGRVRSVDRPLPTITTAKGGALGVVQPFLLGQQSCAAPRATDQPVPTICTDGAIGLVEPFVVKYYGTGEAKSLELPLDTVTTKDRFLLIEPQSGRTLAELDIRFRMLQPHELAAAMSFPKTYTFTGTRAAQVKQIGNAVPVELARAHARALLTPETL